MQNSIIIGVFAILIAVLAYTSFIAPQPNPVSSTNLSNSTASSPTPGQPSITSSPSSTPIPTQIPSPTPQLTHHTISLPFGGEDNGGGGDN